MSVKGLHRMIYPFAPDQSGASSVLYSLGGMIIIVDAGGCAGNVCGFDEPRWLGTKSAIFSAGLRDMDAIMGRDDLLIDKIAKASQKLEASFIALIGTPVPATIATDYRALRRMAEKRTGLPVITMDTNGAAWYDEGIEKAYAVLIDRFAEDAEQGDASDAVRGFTGVLGMTPMDFGSRADAGLVRDALAERCGGRVICYGMPDAGDAPDTEAAGIPNDPLGSFRQAGRAELNIVTAPAGLKAARTLKDRFGTPYECFDPLAADAWQKARAAYSEENGADSAETLAGKKILIIHQQIRANTIRDLIRGDLQKNGTAAGGTDVTVASWFMMDDEIKEEGDFRIREEHDFFNVIESGGYDVIIADGSFRKAAKGFDGIFIDLPHFAVSGTLQ